MKIISRKDLMALPAGTVWSYYEPCVFHDLYIKDSEPEPDYPDFSNSSLVGAFEWGSGDYHSEGCGRMEKGESLPVDFEFSGREGMFDDKQLFAVYEPSDVDLLIKRLIAANSNVRTAPNK
jgi:hypothetical protein